MGDPDEELIKELHAQFGLAYFRSECLHRELCNAYVLAPFAKSDGITGPRVDERTVEAFAMTLGKIVEAIEPWTTAELQATLDEAVERRNFLAHRFWFERCHLMADSEGARGLIDTLRADSEFFLQADEKVSAHFADQVVRLGISAERQQQALREMLERKEEWQEPSTQRRLRKQETIVRVWDVPVSDDQSTLIFELQDGSRWQLSDAGLGWTRFLETSTDWAENPRITPHLPATTNPRPGAPGAWHYELALGASAKIVVRLSEKKPRAFTWRLKIPD